MIKIKEKYNSIVNAFCIVDMFLLVTIVFYQVVARKVFASSPIWTGEAARFLMVWLIFIGSSIAFRERGHLGVDYFTGLLPKNAQKWAAILVDLILLAVIALLIYRGFTLGAFVKQQVSPAMQISMSIPYFAMPIGGLMMAIEIIWHLIFDYRQNTVQPKGVKQ